MRELAFDNPDTPLLELFEPDHNWGTGGWNDKLRIIAYHMGVPPEIIADRVGGRSSTFAYLKGDRGREIPQHRLEELAALFGFPPNAWLLPNDQFVDLIFELYPGYRFRIPAPAEQEPVPTASEPEPDTPELHAA